MQRILNISLLILAILLSVPASAQSGSSDSQSGRLKEYEDVISYQAEAINALCPMETANGLVIVEASYDPVLKELVYTIDTDADLYSYDVLSRTASDNKSSTVDTFYNSAEMKPMLEALIGLDASLVYDYRYPDGKRIKLEITADDLRKGGQRTEADVVSNALYNINKMIKVDTYPMQVDEITVLDEVFIKGDKLCYRYTISPSTPRFSDQGASIIRNNIEQKMLTIAPARNLAMYCINAGLTMEHSYNNPSWPSPVTISFTPEQLKFLLCL